MVRLATLLITLTLLCPLMANSRKFVGKGQQTPDAPRVVEIRQALARAGYYGDWKTALRQYQADHGWQTRRVPDARALIDLGLGPRYAHILNPRTAWVDRPATQVGQ